MSALNSYSHFIWFHFVYYTFQPSPFCQWNHKIKNVDWQQKGVWLQMCLRRWWIARARYTKTVGESSITPKSIQTHAEVHENNLEGKPTTHRYSDPATHYISTPCHPHAIVLSFFFAVGWIFFRESVRLRWAKWVFRCVSNEFIFGIARFFCTLIHVHKMIQYTHCCICTPAIDCLLGFVYHSFPFCVAVSLYASRCVYVSVSDAFLCHLHTLHYVSGVRCIFFDYLASSRSVGGSGVFALAILSVSHSFGLANVNSTLSVYAIWVWVDTTAIPNVLSTAACIVYGGYWVLGMRLYGIRQKVQS